MSKQEVLSPTHRPDGRFAPGNNANPNGRGNAAGITGKAIKEMVKEALDNMGGVDYLMVVAATDMKAFCALVGKTIPLKLVSDEESPFVIHVIEHRIVDPKK